MIIDNNGNGTGDVDLDIGAQERQWTLINQEVYRLRHRFLLWGVWWCYVWRRGGVDPSDCIVGMSRDIIFARHTRGYLQDDILSPHIIIQHQYNVCVALIADY